MDEALLWIRDATASPLVIGQQREHYLKALAVALGVRYVFHIWPGDIQEPGSPGRRFLDSSDANERYRLGWLPWDTLRRGTQQRTETR